MLIVPISLCFVGQQLLVPRVIWCCSLLVIDLVPVRCGLEAGSVYESSFTEQLVVHSGEIACPHKYPYFILFPERARYSRRSDSCPSLAVPFVPGQSFFSVSMIR